MNRSIVPSFLGSLALFVVADPVPAQDRGKADEALRPLATSLAAYLDARASSVGLEAAKSALAANLETLGRTLGGDALLHHAELGRAWWLSRAHPAERGGKVATGVCEEGSFTDAGMSYAYRLPREYDPASAYPLILAIPAEDEKTADHLRAD